MQISSAKCGTTKLYRKSPDPQRIPAYICIWLSGFNNKMLPKNMQIAGPSGFRKCSELEIAFPVCMLGLRTQALQVCQLFMSPVIKSK